MADLAVWQRTIVDEEGNVIPGAEIEVRREEDDSLATLYADRAGETLIDNPLSADSSGFVRFYAEGGAYKVTATGAGSSQTWRFVALGRLGERDGVDFSTIAEAQSFNVPASVGSLRVAGRDVPGDGRGGVFIRGDEGGDAFQTADGQWWVPSYQAGVYGQPDKAHRIVGGSIRRDTQIEPDWFVISDTAHIPINLDSVETLLNARINYDGTDIGTLIVAPDETFARKGVIAGASVGRNSSVLSMGASCGVVYDLDTGEVEFDEALFQSDRFSIEVLTSGQIRLSHPNPQSHASVFVQHLGQPAYRERVSVENVIPGATTTLFLCADLAGEIAYQGSGAWGYTNGPSYIPAGKVSAAFDEGTGVLTVTHPRVLNNNIPIVAPKSNGTSSLVPVLYSHTSTGFSVRFFDYEGNVSLSTSAVDHRFYFTRGHSMILDADMVFGKIQLYAGPVQVDMRQVDLQGANLWILGAMGKTV